MSVAASNVTEKKADAARPCMRVSVEALAPPSKLRMPKPAIRLRHQGYLGCALSPGRPPYRMFYYGAAFARGAQRRNRALMADLRFRGQADMGDRLVSTSWVAIDPKRTKTGLKSRSAAVFCRIVCRRRLDSEQFRS